MPLWARPIIAGDAIAFYLYKLIWPLKLAVDYGRTPRETLASGWAYVTALVPLAMAIVLWRKRRAWPIVCAGAVVFVQGMLPVSGLVRFDFQIYSTVADHYLYLPMLGVAMIVAAVLAHGELTVAATHASQRRSAGDDRRAEATGGNEAVPLAKTRLSLILCIVVISLLAVRTWLQAQTWKDSTALFSHALEVNPNSWMSHDNLAAALLRQGRSADAKVQALAEIAIKPDVAVAYDKLAACLHMEGNDPQAIDAYRKATQLQSNDATAWAGLADIFINHGDRAGAIDAYTHAVAANPDDADLLVNYASSLAEDGQLQRAIEAYQSALKIKPDSPQALAGLAKATEEKDRKEKPQIKDEHR